MTFLKSLLLGDAQADRVVPPTGFTAQLTLFVSGAMAFLCVFALALSMASGRVADRWADELARAATLRINAPASQKAAQTEAALKILEQTPGVASARALTAEEQAALLSPWFGSGLPVDSLPIPQLIEVIEGDAGYDATGLRLRLQAEVPGAVLDDHARWRRPLVDAALALRRLSVVSILLIGGGDGRHDHTCSQCGAFGQCPSHRSSAPCRGAGQLYCAGLCAPFHPACLGRRRGGHGARHDRCSIDAGRVRGRRFSNWAWLSGLWLAFAACDPASGRCGRLCRHHPCSQ